MRRRCREGTSPHQEPAAVEEEVGKMISSFVRPANTGSVPLGSTRLGSDRLALRRSVPPKRRLQSKVRVCAPGRDYVPEEPGPAPHRR